MSGDRASSQSCFALAAALLQDERLIECQQQPIHVATLAPTLEVEGTGHKELCSECQRALRLCAEAEVKVRELQQVIAESRKIREESRRRREASQQLRADLGQYMADLKAVFDGMQAAARERNATP